MPLTLKTKNTQRTFTCTNCQKKYHEASLAINCQCSKWTANPPTQVGFYSFKKAGQSDSWAREIFVFHGDETSGRLYYRECDRGVKFILPTSANPRVLWRKKQYNW